MKRTVQKKGLLILLFLWAFQFNSFSQKEKVTGIWRGHFVGNGGDTYRLEFQLVQNADGKVSMKGVSYSWQDDKRFYGKATMTGSYVAGNKNLRIHEIQTVEVQNPMGGTCIMNYDLIYSRSGKEEFLEGTYLGRTEVKGRENPYEWGECGGGRVMLRKVPTTEFYLEPFLRDNKATASPKPPVSHPLVNKPPSTTTVDPSKKPPVNTTPKPKTKTPVTTNKPKTTTTKPLVTTKPPVTNKLPVAQKPVPVPKDSTRVTALPPAEKPTIPAARPVVPAPEILKTRKNELMKALVVNDPDVTVKLFDNGEIDGDTISVYLDNRLVLSNKLLTAAPLTLKIKMDEANPEHELVMVAENLGRIPPNTALMIVEAGKQRFEVMITSTEQKNALIRFRYEKP